jgi:hypothetical protein
MSKNSAKRNVQTLKEWITFMKIDKRKPKKTESNNESNWIVSKSFKNK